MNRSIEKILNQKQCHHLQNICSSPKQRTRVALNRSPECYVAYVQLLISEKIESRTWIKLLGVNTVNETYQCNTFVMILNIWTVCKSTIKVTLPWSLLDISPMVWEKILFKAKDKYIPILMQHVSYFSKKSIWLEQTTNASWNRTKTCIEKELLSFVILPLCWCRLAAMFFNQSIRLKQTLQRVTQWTFVSNYLGL